MTTIDIIIYLIYLLFNYFEIILITITPLSYLIRYFLSIFILININKTKIIINI